MNLRNLPIDFIRKTFAIRRPQFIMVQDEQGRIYKCNMSQDRSISEANIGGEWKKLCIENELRQENLIEFETNPADYEKRQVYVLDV